MKTNYTIDSSRAVKHDPDVHQDIWQVRSKLFRWITTFSYFLFNVLVCLMGKKQQLFTISEPVLPDLQLQKGNWISTITFNSIYFPQISVLLLKWMNEAPLMNPDEPWWTLMNPLLFWGSGGWEKILDRACVRCLERESNARTHAHREPWLPPVWPLSLLLEAACPRGAC